VHGAWQTLAAGPWNGGPGFSDYTPPGRTGLYAAENGAAFRFDPVGSWTTLAAPPADLDSWPGLAWVGDDLYAVKNGNVYRYSISGNAWTTPVAGGVANAQYAQSTHDDAGNVYTVESDVPYRVIRYNTSTKQVTYLATGGFNGTVFEPRITWDPPTARLYIGVAYYSPELWAFDPAAPGTAVRRADAPNAALAPGTGMGDPFCGDRSGHIYAIGDTGCSDSNTVFQYETRTNTWRRIPDLPENHGCSGACTVSDDGWLYLAPGYPQSLYRIKLL
jgi:hypothetical protein